MDIHKDGKGIWYVIHTLALTNQKDHFEWMIKTLCNHFSCESCKIHLKKYIDENPIHDCFKWSWELHNDVNKRLNKSTISYIDALNLYKNNICKDCDKPINLITR